MKKYTKILFAWFFLLGLTLVFGQDVFCQGCSSQIKFSATVTTVSKPQGVDTVKIKLSFSDTLSCEFDSVIITFLGPSFGVCSLSPSPTPNTCSTYTWTPTVAKVDATTFNVILDGPNDGTPCGMSNGSLVVVLTEVGNDEGTSATWTSANFYRNGTLVAHLPDPKD